MQQQWRGFATVTDGFLSEPGPARGQYTVLAEDLAGKTVLIVGYGSIGAAIEARLAPFGVTVLRVARTARVEPKVHPVSATAWPAAAGGHRGADRAADGCDARADRRGGVGLMKRGALLVNAARGPVVDTDALVAALSEQRIRAAVDVTDPEPLPADHPLWRAPNCLITPHIGGSTPEFISPRVPVRRAAGAAICRPGSRWRTW